MQCLIDRRVPRPSLFALIQCNSEVPFPAPELPVGLAEASSMTASQLSFSLSSSASLNPFPGIIPKGVSDQFSVHTPVHQNLLPKEHGQNQPLLAKNVWFEIWKMRKSQPRIRVGKEQRQNPWSRGRASKFQRKEANIVVLLKFIQPASSGIRIQTWVFLTLKFMLFSLPNYELPSENRGLCCIKYCIKY